MAIASLLEVSLLLTCVVSGGPCQGLSGTLFPSARVHEEVKMAIHPVSVQQPLKGMEYPAKKQDLINKAKQEGADPQVGSALEKLPENRDFQSAADGSQALGQIL